MITIIIIIMIIIIIAIIIIIIIIIIINRFFLIIIKHQKAFPVRCSSKGVFCKHAVNLQERTHAEA